MYYYTLIVFSYFLTGALAGTLSGLLGIGGGLLVVPALAFIYQHQHFNNRDIMQMAAGTSLAIMVITTSRSLLSHLHHKIEFWPVYSQLLPGVIVGTILGVSLAHFVHSNVLRIIFGIFVILVALKMFFLKSVNAQRQLPRKSAMASIGAIIGGKSGLLGVGGGALTVPFLTYCNVPMRQAVVISIATGMTVAAIGAVGYAIVGHGVIGRPDWSTGYIYWPAWLGVAAGSVLFAPLGARLSHVMPVPLLKKLFGVLLVVIGVKMLSF